MRIHLFVVFEAGKAAKLFMNKYV